MWRVTRVTRLCHEPRDTARPGSPRTPAWCFLPAWQRQTSPAPGPGDSGPWHSPLGRISSCHRDISGIIFYLMRKPILVLPTWHWYSPEWMMLTFWMANLQLSALSLTNKRTYKFHVHQCQAQIEIWCLPDIHLSLTWPPDYHLTFPWPLQDPYLTYKVPEQNSSPIL